VEADALEERVLQLRVHRAFFVQDFLKFCVIVPRLLATQILLNSGDFLVWLVLLGVPQVVLLALVEVTIAIALLVAVALGEVVILLVFLVSPPCRHVT
jgi:hypothetical protein